MTKSVYEIVVEIVSKLPTDTLLSLPGVYETICHYLEHDILHHPNYKAPKWLSDTLS